MRSGCDPASASQPRRGMNLGATDYGFESGIAETSRATNSTGQNTFQGWLTSTSGRAFSELQRALFASGHPFLGRSLLRLRDGMNRPTTNSTTMSTSMPMR